MSFTIASILPRVAARLNDPNQDIFTNAALIPFAQDAGDELQGQLELNGILVLEAISTIIVFPVNLNPTQGNLVSLGGLGLLPTDMYEPQRLEERLSGTTDMFMPMIRRQWEPNIQPTDELRYWVYRAEDIYFVGCTTQRDIKIYYLRHLVNVIDATSTIGVNNAQQFMITRIAALAARNIGENPTRADELDKEAEANMNWLIRIGVKSKQGTRTRRRPYVIVGRRRWI
jgi:hypothetical protein